MLDGEESEDEDETGIHDEATLFTFVATLQKPHDDALAAEREK
jgi:hypothetical protein